MTHYDRLGVSFTASEHDISRAWRAKARQLHPDAGGDAEEFRLAEEAYRVLSNSTSRELYNKTLEYEQRLEQEEQAQHQPPDAGSYQAHAQEQAQRYPVHAMDYVPRRFTSPLSWPRPWAIAAGVLMLLGAGWLGWEQSKLAGPDAMFLEVGTFFLLLNGGLVFFGIWVIWHRIWMYGAAIGVLFTLQIVGGPTATFGMVAPSTLLVVGVELARFAHRKRQAVNPALRAKPTRTTYWA